MKEVYGLSRKFTVVVIPDTGQHSGPEVDEDADDDGAQTADDDQVLKFCEYVLDVECTNIEIQTTPTM